MNVNISWYSPLDARASEIARYSWQILPVIGRHLGIAGVWSEEGRAAPEGWYGGELAPPIPGVDPLPVYHIGNNPLHLPIYEQSLREPGLVILHDLSLVDLARQQSHQAGEPELWKELMYRQYGDEIRALVNLSENSVDHYNEMVANYPLFQPYIEGAIGVVVHSRHAEHAVNRQTEGTLPVRYLPLPGAPCPGEGGASRGNDPLRFVFCGHVGPNRRLVQFLEAWGGLSAPGRIRLELFGNISSSKLLLDYARHFNVAEYLEFRGYVSDDELDLALQSADFALNLRWPSMGEASASQLRYWAAGLPTLVSDVGWYGEQPDDVVCKIAVSEEIPQIRALLQDALADPGKYREIGLRGCEHLRRRHLAAEYARQLTDFAVSLTRGRLAWRTLDRNLVGVIASLCDSETQIPLFRHAIETASTVLDAQLIDTGET